MDTRNKIIPASAAAETARRLRAEGRKLTVVTGTFDVLLAAHARDLGTATDALIVILLPSAAPLLAERARAELIAALHMVDYVVVGDEGSAAEVLRQLGADEVISRRSADAEERRRLIEHVQRRHSQ